MKQSPQICSAAEFKAEYSRGYVRPGDQLLDDDGNRFVVLKQAGEQFFCLIRLSDGSIRSYCDDVAYPAAWLSGAEREGI